MAFDHLFREERIDLVISGINHGSNSAVNVLYSGTMGAAIEGELLRLPDRGPLALRPRGRRRLRSLDRMGQTHRGRPAGRRGRAAALPQRQHPRRPPGDDPRPAPLPPEPRLLARGVLPPRGSPRPHLLLAHGRLRQRRARRRGHRRMGAGPQLRLGGAHTGRHDRLPRARDAAQRTEKTNRPITCCSAFCSSSPSPCRRSPRSMRCGSCAPRSTTRCGFSSSWASRRSPSSGSCSSWPRAATTIPAGGRPIWAS